MHRERYRARRRLEAAAGELVAAMEEDPEDVDDLSDKLDAAIKEYAQLFVEDDGGG